MTALASLATRWRTTPGAAAFASFIGVLAAALTAISVLTGPVVPRYSHVEFSVLATLAVLADLGPVPRGRRNARGWVSLSVCFTFVIMLVWGVGAAIAVQTVATAGAAWRGRLGVGGAILTWGQYVCALTVAGAVLRQFGTTEFKIGVHIDYTNIGTVLAPALAWLVTSQLIVVVAARLRDQTWQYIRTPAMVYQLLITSGLILIGPVLMSEPTGLMTVLVVVPLLAVSWAYRQFGEQEHRMFRDPLTGLLNRRGLMTELRGSPGSAMSGPEQRHGGHDVALLLVRLDQLGDVSGMVGRGVHDELLVLIGRSLAQTVNGRGVVGRLSEDEFAVVSFGVVDERAAVTLANEICGSLGSPTSVRGVPFDVSATVGITVSHQREHDLSALVRSGDVAIAEARRRGEFVRVYSPHAAFGVAERLDLLADFRLAIEDPAHAGEITMNYQPQMSLVNGELVGVESLVRWHHARRGLVDPESVLRVVEPSAVMGLLTTRVIHDVVGQLDVWASQGLTVRASVNVSMRDLHDGQFVERVAQALDDVGVSADSLALEVTEGALLTDSGRVLTTVRGLADMGVALSLDDFGTGYSSIQHLQDLPLTEIKIDQSFVRTMAADPNSDAIVRAIVQLAGALGLRTVAEGIEDERTCRLLADAGCEVGQGWYFGRPMPAHELLARAARRGPWGRRDCLPPR